MSWIVIVSSIHIQDLQDEIGDRAMGRKTFPICLGQTLSRSSIIASIIICTVYLPFMWEVTGMFQWYLSTLGGWIGLRVWCLRAKAEDEKSFRIYNVSDFFNAFFNILTAISRFGWFQSISWRWLLGSMYRYYMGLLFEGATST